jgi:ferredoxin
MLSNEDMCGTCECKIEEGRGGERERERERKRDEVIRRESD